jgi:hypothetical protein
MANNQHDGVLIVLHNPANGRRCNQHEYCGKHLVAGELVQFKKVIGIDYGPPGDPVLDFWYGTVIKVVVIQDGVASCQTGFLPRHVVAHVHVVIGLHGNFAQILELCDSNKVGNVKKNKSDCNHGMDSYHLLNVVLKGSFFLVVKLTLSHSSHDLRHYLVNILD